MKRTLTTRLTEDSVGITEYVRPGDGFSAIVKARYSDFQVNEIDERGALAELTEMNFTAPDDDPMEPPDENEPVSPEHIRQLKDLVKGTRREPVEMDAADMTKERRTEVHQAVKRRFKDSIVGSTVDRDGGKYLVFSKRTRGVRVDNRQKWNHTGDYVHFVVYKENCDTMEAASRISETLNMKHIKPTFFGYCGTKDKRAKTTQWFSIKRVEPKKIIQGCKRLRNIMVGNFKIETHHLKLGLLKGNRFRIALRNITEDHGRVEVALNHLKDNGFINYFGLQRFGSRANVPTYAIGKSLIQGDFKKAVDLILEPHGFDYEILNKYKETGNAQTALQGVKFSPRTIEMKLLLALKNETATGTSKYINALNKLPRNTRLIYIHSYQSWVWNRCVSERLKKFGYKCEVGDLVLKNPTSLYDNFTEIGTNFVSENDEKYSNADQNDDSNPIDESKESECLNDLKSAVKSITEDDIKENRYSIYDVILPLPGFNVEYPSNMKEFYHGLLANDNLDLDLKQKLKCYSLGGTYRHVLAKPANLSWELIRYTDPQKDLILSDFDKIKKKQPIKSESGGKYTALILSFSLPSSVYATMALRELTKMDTSSEIQAQNNDYYKTGNAESKKYDGKASNASGQKRNVSVMSSEESAINKRVKMDTD